MKIKSIKLVQPRTVYAIKTSSGTFISDGLAHHNCAPCNLYKRGNPSVYALELTKRYGPHILEELQLLRKENYKINRAEYEELIEKYKNLIK